MGLGCYPSNNKEHTNLLTSLFCYDAASKTISTSNNPTETMYECVAYLFECCYDLLLSTASNVSVNPGFEKFTGQY